MYINETVKKQKKHKHNVIVVAAVTCNEHEEENVKTGHSFFVCSFLCVMCCEC